MLGVPEKADPEIAAVTFQDHLSKVFSGSIALELELEKTVVDQLHVIVRFVAIGRNGERDDYYVLLGAEYYDSWPPTAVFIDPKTRMPAEATSPWWPVLDPNPPWLGLHNSYRFQDGSSGQMICFSATAEYYRSNHSPTADAEWKRGKQTVSRTIHRIAEFLRQPYYKGRAA